MKAKTKLPLKWGDFLIFLLILAAACGIWGRYAWMQTDQTYGEIWLDGELYQKIKLGAQTHETIAMQGKRTNVSIEAEGKKMRFVFSECADHTCERTGWISHAGQTAVCLPNRVMIKIIGNTGTDDVDIIVQ